MIQQVNGGYVISSRHQWLPGQYADERAARYAFKFDYAVLQSLQDKVNPGGIITFEMLQTARAESQDER